MLTSAEIVANARRAGLAVPAFNVPYLPMIEPVVRAMVDQDCFALIETAHIEWMTWESRGPAAVMEEFRKWEQPDYVRLHLDHVPVLDESCRPVDYRPIFQEALALGYGSVMIDASRLDLEANIQATGEAVEMAHAAGVPCEAELGAVLGHEAGPLPPYDELFASGIGFTRVDEARRFVAETGCDWLSVAVGSFHGRVTPGLSEQRKTEARLKLDLLEEIHAATGVPLVLHGGSGVRQEDLLAGIQIGLAKINIGTEIRQAYEAALRRSGKLLDAQQAVYDGVCTLVRDTFGLQGTRSRVTALR